MIMPACDGVVRLLIDKHEAAGGAVLGAAVEEDRRIGAQADAADVVEVNSFTSSLLLQRGDVRLCRARR